MSDVSNGPIQANRPNHPEDGSAGSSDDPGIRAAAGPGAPRWLRVGLVFLQVGPAIGLVLMVLVISQLSEVFLSPRNIGNVLSQSAVICVLAMGQLLVIVTRGIDLSVGSTLALGTVVGALVFAGCAPTPDACAARGAAGSPTSPA